MAFLKKANCARTTINQSGGINATDVSLTVTDASDFPNSGNFLVTVWDKVTYPDPCDDPNKEILKVTNVVGNVFTIERGQEDTIGVIHTNGQAVEMLITAGTFEELEDEINSLSPGQQVNNEILSSQINGITDSFNTSFNYVAGTLKIYVGGLRQSPGVGLDYTETGANSFELNYVPISGEKMIVDYTKS